MFNLPKKAGKNIFENSYCNKASPIKNELYKINGFAHTNNKNKSTTPKIAVMNRYFNMTILFHLIFSLNHIQKELLKLSQCWCRPPNRR